MICRHKLYHFTVATRRGKTKFATIKWYNLCLQIFQSQTCYPLIFFSLDNLLNCYPLNWLNNQTNVWGKQVPSETLTVNCDYWNHDTRQTADQVTTLSTGDITPEVPQSPDACLSWAFVVRGFISIISKDKMQEKNTERLKFHDFNICPNSLHADTDAGGIAIALLHLSAGALKIEYLRVVFEVIILETFFFIWEVHILRKASDVGINHMFSLFCGTLDLNIIQILTDCAVFVEIFITQLKPIAAKYRKHQIHMN